VARIIRVVIELKRGEESELILNSLYKYTDLQNTFGVIMLALVDNTPKVLNLKQILENYLKHRYTVITRRVQFELNKAEARAHILEGFRIALDNIDEVAWYAENSNYLIQDVGLKKPNQLGLFDCSGNIWEWCYDTEEMENIKSLHFNFDPSSAYRRIRGGSWLHSAESCATFYRIFETAAYVVLNTGFRIVRTI